MTCDDAFVFSPLLKVKVWGGDRLGALYPETTSLPGPLGEAWVFCCLEDEATPVKTGVHAGATARELLHRFGPSLAGPAYQRYLDEGYPLLLKLIDARQRLSLQVHPDDEAARRLEGQSRGKCEAWYVLAAEPGAPFFLGTTSTEPATTLLPSLAEQGRTEALQVVEALPDSVYPVSAGTLHAIGEGIFLAEIQQSSDTTYRVHDWGRRGLDGVPRPLHLDKAIACAKTGPWQPPPRERPSWSDDGGSIELLARCDYFAFERIRLNHRLEFAAPEQGFSLLLPISGDVTLLHGDRTQRLPAHHGTMIPACWPTITLVPADETATVLRCVPLEDDERKAPWRGHPASAADRVRF